MSAPPLGGISLTFMLDHTISLLLYLLHALCLRLPERSLLFLSIIQSAPPLLCMNHVETCSCCLSSRIGGCRTLACRETYANLRTSVHTYPVAAAVSDVSDSVVCKKRHLFVLTQPITKGPRVRRTRPERQPTLMGLGTGSGSSTCIQSYRLIIDCYQGQ